MQKQMLYILLVLCFFTSFHSHGTCQICSDIFLSSDTQLLPPRILNEEHYFDSTSPAFYIEPQGGEEKIWWQIDSQPDFSYVISSLDVLQDYENCIIPSFLEEALFQPNQNYFFRARVCRENVWGEWSAPFEFTLFEPATCEDVIFDESHCLALRKMAPPAYPWMQERIHDPSLGVYYKYVRNPYVNEETWEELQPYFLPEDHPAKMHLDRIFSKNRVLASKHALRDSGFKPVTHPVNSMIVARHSDIHGYLFKMYLDDTRPDDTFWWKRRIDGVRLVQACIDRHGYNDLLKTPRKWIYPLPPEPSPKPSKKNRRKDFILVVEEMDILKSKKNRIAYRKLITPKMLDALYVVFTENLLVDSIYEKNIPFCEDGKIAFLDTEFFNITDHTLKLGKLNRYLSSEMSDYWDWLVSQGGPQ